MATKKGGKKAEVALGGRLMKKKPKIQILKSVINGEFYARLIASNGKEVWRTSETYERIAGVRGAIKVLQSPIEIVDTTKAGSE